jgi:PKD repeat protein/sugar lactone lactonase YvrE
MNIIFKTKTFFLCLMLFAATSICAAEMPQYQRLTPITDNIISPNVIAVDSLDNIYVVETVYNKLMIYSHRDEYVATLKDLDRPISVAVDEYGNIFVGNHYDIFSNKGNVEVYDSGLNFLFKLGDGDGEFSQPNAIAIDSDTEKIYVTDKEAHEVKVYLSNGDFDFSFDGTAGGGEQFVKPTAIGIDETNREIIVIDRPLTSEMLDGARLQIYDMDGFFKDGFSKHGKNEGDMYKPKHLTVDSEGRIYVTDSEHHKVLVYDREGTYLGAVYDEDNPIIIPKGIAVSGANRLYVASLTLNKVEVYGINLFTQMEVAPLSLTFEGEKGGAALPLQEIQISNSGTGTLNWTAEADESWITLSAVSGTTGPASATALNAGVDISTLSEGAYIGSVTVQSESGATEIVNVGLTVTYTPLAISHGGPYAAQEGETITLDASGSIGGIVLYEWDVDNDGIYDYSSASPTQDHAYTQTGTHYITLKITDNTAATSEATTFAEISDSIPSVGFTASTTSGCTPLSVAFTNLTTGFDIPFTYEWDFDYDGTTDSTDESPSHTYYEVGTYSVKLTVRDSDGSENTLTRAFYITVTAEECQNSYVMISTAGYTSISGAYAVASNGNDMLIRDGVYSEALTLNRDVSIKITGGYDCDYNVPEGQATINGEMVINNGTIIIENGTIIID